MAIKTDTWTASIVDLSYPLTLSRLLFVRSTSSVVRVSAGGGPGVGPGEMSREGGCESEDCDEFGRSLRRVLPSTVIVVGSGIGPVDGWIGCVGIGCVRVLFGFLT